VRSALEWAQARALVVDGVSGPEITRRLGMNRGPLARSRRAPRYRRPPAGSKLDPFEPVGAARRVRLRRFGRSCKAAAVCAATASGAAGAADRLSAGAGAAVNWAEMPTRPILFGRERRVYALVWLLPYSGAQTARGGRSPRGRPGRMESPLPAPARPLRLPCHRLHAGDAAREERGRGGGALPQERLLAGAPARGSGPA
jgi:hypothetical protein